jgi:hypothetical protein
VRQAEVSHVEPAPESTEEEVQRNLPFNFGVLLGHGLLGQTGFRLIQAPTFLPKYVELLAGNNTAVGIARAVQSLGMFLSPGCSSPRSWRRGPSSTDHGSRGSGSCTGQ